MLIDLRYHLISLVAVFLALAVGILVGSSFIVGSSIERQVAQGLERQFGTIRAENRKQQQLIENLREQTKKQMEFGRAAAPMLVHGRLSWRRVAVIQTGDYSSAAQSAKSILEEAGAKVTSVTTLSNLDSPSALERAGRAVELITGVQDEHDPRGRMLSIVADCIAGTASADALGVCEGKGLLSTVGDYERRVLTIVLVGGAKQAASRRAEHTDLVLIDKLKEHGAITIIGCEPFDAVMSYIPAYHRKAIPTVDNIDQPSGQVGLVFAVGGETGNLGAKKSADHVAPAYLESGQWRSEFPR